MGCWSCDTCVPWYCRLCKEEHCSWFEEQCPRYPEHDFIRAKAERRAMRAISVVAVSYAAIKIVLGSLR